MKKLTDRLMTATMGTMAAMTDEYSPMEIGRLSDCLAGLTQKFERVERTIQGLEAMHKSAGVMLGVDWLMFNRHEKTLYVCCAGEDKW